MPSQLYFNGLLYSRVAHRHNSIGRRRKNSYFLAPVGTGHISQTIIKTKVIYGGILDPNGEVKLAIALSPRPFSSPTAQN